MGRPNCCCTLCDTTFAINKTTGKIQWHRNLYTDTIDMYVDDYAYVLTKLRKNTGSYPASIKNKKNMYALDKDVGTIQHHLSYMYDNLINYTESLAYQYNTKVYRHNDLTYVVCSNIYLYFAYVYVYKKQYLIQSFSIDGLHQTFDFDGKYLMSVGYGRAISNITEYTKVNTDDNEVKLVYGKNITVYKLDEDFILQTEPVDIENYEIRNDDDNKYVYYKRKDKSPIYYQVEHASNITHVENNDKLYFSYLNLETLKFGHTEFDVNGTFDTFGLDKSALKELIINHDKFIHIDESVPSEDDIEIIDDRDDTVYQGSYPFYKFNNSVKITSSVGLQQQDEIYAPLNPYNTETHIEYFNTAKDLAAADIGTLFIKDEISLVKGYGYYDWRNNTYGTFTDTSYYKFFNKNNKNIIVNTDVSFVAEVGKFTYVIDSTYTVEREAATLPDGYCYVSYDGTNFYIDGALLDHPTSVKVYNPLINVPDYRYSLLQTGIYRKRQDSDTRLKEYTISPPSPINEYTLSHYGFIEHVYDYDLYYIGPSLNLDNVEGIPFSKTYFFDNDAIDKIYHNKYIFNNKLVKNRIVVESSKNFHSYISCQYVLDDKEVRFDNVQLNLTEDMIKNHPLVEYKSNEVNNINSTDYSSIEYQVVSDKGLITSNGGSVPRNI